MDSKMQVPIHFTVEPTNTVAYVSYLRIEPGFAPYLEVLVVC